MLATNLELQHSIWQHKKLTRIENKLDPIIPEPVLGHVPGNTLLCLCQTPISNHPGSGGSKKLLLISWKYTRSHYTRNSHMSVMCQALLSCISLPDPLYQIIPSAREWAGAKNVYMLEKKSNPIIPEPVSFTSCSKHCSPLYLSYPLIRSSHQTRIGQGKNS